MHFYLKAAHTFPAQDAKVVTVFNMIAVPCFVYQVAPDDSLHVIQTNPLECRGPLAYLGRDCTNWTSCERVHLLTIIVDSLINI